MFDLFEAKIIRGSPFKSLLGQPGTRDWVAQRPRVKQNTTDL